MKADFVNMKGKASGSKGISYLESEVPAPSLKTGGLCMEPSLFRDTQLETGDAAV